MRRAPLLALLLAALAVLPGCDSGSDVLGLTGRWEGEITTEGASYPVEVRFNDTGRSITGTGTVRASNTPVVFSVTSGSFVGTTVDLQVAFNEVPFQGGLTGRLTGNDPGQIDGTFNGPQRASGAIRIELVSR